MKRCYKCKGVVSYSELYDTHYCAKCLVYLDSKCSDEDCVFCPKRPDKVGDL